LKQGAVIWQFGASVKGANPVKWYLCGKPVRAAIFVENGIKNLKLRQERNRQNMPLLTELDLVWIRFYKDVAPTALFKGANPAK
jgi:hypothetical protein